MVFTSLTFIFLILPLFLALDASAKSSRIDIRNAVLLFVSVVFYTWGEGANVFILILMGIINYIAGEVIHKAGNKKPYLILFVTLNLFTLFSYKFLCWLVAAIAPGVQFPNIAMPLGISFFSFHAMSYLFDIYSGTTKPARNINEFLTYFCMFPHLVAGPIVRFAQVKSDLEKRGPSRELAIFGAYRFLLGLNKKVLIANTVAPVADTAFLLCKQGELSSPDAWVGILAYAVQIYFDFSGYSDMAIGLAALAGFHFEENFKRPYSSLTVREFWRRWHISLSTWFRDYLYIPMGGNALGRTRTYVNLVMVFFLCGLWHGANVTFIVWGLWNGFFLVFERVASKFTSLRMPSPALKVYFVLVTLIGWVFFRSENITQAMDYIGSMFSSGGSFTLTIYHAGAMGVLAVALMLCAVPDKYIPCPDSANPDDFFVAPYAAQAVLSFFSVAMLLKNMRNPFIYFNF